MHNYLIILVLLFPWTFIYADNNQWQCTAVDIENKTWVFAGIYQKITTQAALAACKKDSKAPMSCKVPADTCQVLDPLNNLQTLWRCTALDANANFWQSTYYPQMYKAAMRANHLCKTYSHIPATCYTNLVTCAKNHEYGKL